MRAPFIEEMAATLYRRRAKLNDCIALKPRSKLKTGITVNDAEVPIQPFVSEIIRNSLLGMVSISGNEEIQIKS